MTLQFLVLSLSVGALGVGIGMFLIGGSAALWVLTNRRRRQSFPLNRHLDHIPIHQ
jgi:hypothetical protein